MNKVQQEQYEVMRELLEKRGFSILDDHYVNTRTKINIKCDQGHQYAVTSETIKKNRLCPECKLLSGPKGETEKIVRDRNGKLLSDYKKLVTKVKIECSEGHVWEMLPISIIKGGWCPECKKAPVKEKLLEHVSSRGGKIISEGQTFQEKYLFECEKEHRWKAKLYDIMNGHWCPKCAMLDPEGAELRFREAIEEKGGLVLGTYVNNRTKVYVRCVNGHEYQVLPTSICQGLDCVQCTGRNIASRSKRFEEYVLSRNGVLLSEYKQAGIKVKLKCEKGHVWEAKPNSMLSRKSWCPVCNESKGERETAIVLDQLRIEYEKEFRLVCTRQKRYDFYFLFEGTDYFLEFDGKQHFKKNDCYHKTDSEFGYRQNVDRLKTYVALNLGYKVIRIDYANIDRIKEIVVEAFNSDRNLHLSDPEMYDWLFIGLTRSFLESECDTSELIESVDNEIELIG